MVRYSVGYIEGYKDSFMHIYYSSPYFQFYFDRSVLVVMDLSILWIYPRSAEFPAHIGLQEVMKLLEDFPLQTIVVVTCGSNPQLSGDPAGALISAIASRITHFKWNGLKCQCIISGFPPYRPIIHRCHIQPNILSQWLLFSEISGASDCLGRSHIFIYLIFVLIILLDYLLNISEL